jgi:hypothetical protein
MQGSTRVNKPLKIDTQVTSDDMDHLWGVINSSRDGTTQVKVDKKILTRLLLDHGNLLNYYSRTSIR